MDFVTAIFVQLFMCLSVNFTLYIDSSVCILETPDGFKEVLKQKRAFNLSETLFRIANASNVVRPK
jgi:hypothetical protein